MRPVRASRRAQRGWVGLIALVLALVIVAMLAKTALTQYGLLGGASVARPNAGSGGGAGTSAGTARGPMAVTPGAAAVTDFSSAPPVPTAPMERARAIEGMIQQQADDRARQIDRAAR